MSDSSNAARAQDSASSLTDLEPDPSGELERDLLSTLGPGTVVEGKHRVDRIIGRGGMGVVAVATHVHLGERVALKFLQVKNEDIDGDFRARFALEARVCAKLRNEHIARVHDVGVWQARIPFMVMEYLEGTDLRRLTKDGTRLPLGQAIDYVVQICEGLAEAHAQGIVHRDLKPANIFVTKRADGSPLVKVLDFGISKWTTAEEGVGELTKTGVMLGSPKYMSPEQLNGTPVDARADVWSIGAMLYQMLTGRPPFDFPQVTQTFMAIASGTIPVLPSVLEPSIPPAVDAVILRCLTREKDKRVQNVAELAGELLEAVESPFAGQARSQIAAFLDPATNAQARAGQLAMTTGSYAAFSLGNTASISAALAPPRSEAPKSTPLKRRSFAVLGVAVAAVAIFAFARSSAYLTETASAGAQAAPSKSFTAKQLTSERATMVMAMEEPPPAVAAPAAPPAPVVARAASYSAPRAQARSAPRPAPEEAASASAPAAVTPSAAATPKPARSANPLEDRQ